MTKLNTEIINGELRERDSLETIIASAKNGYYIIEFKRKRTLNTNNYFHLIIGILTETLATDGFTFNDTKNAVKDELGLYELFKLPSGKMFKKYISSADFSPEQMNGAIELIIRWGAERGKIILTSEEYNNRLKKNKRV